MPGKIMFYIAFVRFELTYLIQIMNKEFAAVESRISGEPRLWLRRFSRRSRHSEQSCVSINDRELCS